MADTRRARLVPVAAYTRNSPPLLDSANARVTNSRVFRSIFQRALFVLVATIALGAAVFAFSACSDDKKEDEGPPWFDCEPLLARLEECGVVIAFDDMTEADPDEAYDSCQFAKGNMWLASYKCFKEKPTCDDFAECLPDHGFITPAETADDDAADDDATDDDTTDDDAA